MSEKVEVRLLLARFWDDSEPVVVACVDRSIWDHWEDTDEEQWRAEGKRTFGADPTDCEWREVWATFAPQELGDAFATPAVTGSLLLDQAKADE